MHSTTILLIATIQLGFTLINLDILQASPVLNKSTTEKTVVNKITYLETKPSSGTYSDHTHKIYLKDTELVKLNKAYCDGDASKYLKMKETKESFYHFHMVNLCRVRKPGFHYKIVQCDGKGKCWDGHDSELDTRMHAST